MWIVSNSLGGKGMYMHLYIHIYTCTYTHARTHVHAHTHKHTNTRQLLKLACRHTACLPYINYSALCLSTAHWLSYNNSTMLEMSKTIDHLHANENILITFLIVVTSWLDALDAHKNVLQPMGIRWSTVIKQLSKWVIRYDLILQTALWR